jgi:methylthioribose-1-phosphate isomerase
MLIKQPIPLIFGVPQDGFYGDLKVKKTFVAELRPGLEGMTDVAKELLRRRIQPVVICDSMMAFCMERKLVSAVHIFSQGRRNDVALCRTGSLAAALCARAHRIPVVLHDGAMPRESRAADLLKIAGMKVTSSKINTYVPLLEEVPMGLIGHTQGWKAGE